MYLTTSPSLAYLHRRFLVRKLAANLRPGKFLEIGVGNGKLYEDLLGLGFTGVCLDLNQDVIDENKIQTRTLDGRIKFLVGDFFGVKDRFDLIVALEVLEHYRDDIICLQKWKSLLSIGGRLILSVPAHQDQWTKNDSAAGHARRYERLELLAKITGAGFRIEAFWCYGFPLLNVSYQISSLFCKEGKYSREQFIYQDSEAGAGAHAVDIRKTAQSGNTTRPPILGQLWRESLWWPFLQLQKAFFRTDLGIGFVVKCRL